MNIQHIITKGGRDFTFYRIDNDTNGNPRYLIHFLTLDIPMSDYGKHTKKIKASGLRIYHGRIFGGGYALQSYNLESDANELERIFFPLINSAGICQHCKKQEITYSVRCGGYVYFCNNCQKVLSGYEIDIQQEDK